MQFIVSSFIIYIRRKNNHFLLFLFFGRSFRIFLDPNEAYIKIRFSSVAVGRARLRLLVCLKIFARIFRNLSLH